MFKAYGQTGQDALMHFMLLRNKKIPRDFDYTGFYLDIGCSVPVTTSNTYGFYEMGWRGLCLDANPDNEADFVAVRPRDIYVNCGVSDAPGVLPFHVFDNPQLNSFDGARAARLPDRHQKTIDVPVKTLSAVIDENVPEGTEIDFASIDVEDLEYQVIQGINFARHRPKIFVIECITPIRNVLASPLTTYLDSVGYDMVAHTGHDTFYVERVARVR